MCVSMQLMNTPVLSMHYVLQEPAKVSELNPNAKVWGNHMVHVEASGTEGGVNKPWEEITDHPPDSIKEGRRNLFRNTTFLPILKLTISVYITLYLYKQFSFLQLTRYLIPPPSPTYFSVFVTI